MASARRPSTQTVAVLEALAAEGTSWRYGYELSSVTGLASGSLYPILARLEDRGMLESEWEKDNVIGRPRRHHFRLTALGVDFAREHIVRRRLATATSAREVWGSA